MSHPEDTHDLEHEKTRFEGFGNLLREAPEWRSPMEGRVVSGLVVAIESNHVVVDAQLKSEGWIPIREFSASGDTPHLQVGDYVDVYVECVEGQDGLTVLSHEKAKKEAVWADLERSFQSCQLVNGTLLGRVRGGFSVDLQGITAFLPSSHLDVRPVRNIKDLIGLHHSFSVLKLDKSQENIVVSRKAAIEESITRSRTKLLSSLEEGDVLDGVVKNITDYGAFIDLGGIDGLLHVTDMSWTRVDHPSSMLSEGEQARVQVLRYNKLTQRISLGMKQLVDDPWKRVTSSYEIGTRAKGVITNIAEYGIFVRLCHGVEGLAHISEVGWTRRSSPLSASFSIGQELEVMVLDLDPARRRISLGIRQCLQNPWEAIEGKIAIGSTLEGEVRNITDFGLFVKVSDELDGMVHVSDLSWIEEGGKAIKKFKPGDKVTVKVLDINPGKERIALGVKQLHEDPLSEFHTLELGAIVTCEVTRVLDDGLEVRAGNLPGFIRKSDLGYERVDQRTDRFAVGEKFDAKVLPFDKVARRLAFSIKAREIQEKREAVEQYGSADSGASLGDILGAAFARKSQDEQAMGGTKDQDGNS